MTLPKKAEKEYLAISPTEGGFTILAEAQHAADLHALLRQHGIACRLEPEAAPGRDALVFTQQVDVAPVEGLLDEYKRAKGS